MYCCLKRDRENNLRVIDIKILFSIRYYLDVQTNVVPPNPSRGATCNGYSPVGDDVVMSSTTDSNWALIQ